MKKSRAWGRLHRLMTCKAKVEEYQKRNSFSVYSVQ